MPLTSKQREDIAKAFDLMRSAPYATDLATFGKSDYWEVADMRRGSDCEDVALLARRYLMDKGWDHRGLRLTLCETEQRQMHAVLTVMFPDGELILDREQPRPVLPSEFRASGCRLLQRWQPDGDQWELLDPGGPV